MNGLTCANGSPWGQYGCGTQGRACAKCEAVTTLACAEFDRGVFFGEHDQQGYTPAERQAQQRKVAA